MLLSHFTAAIEEAFTWSFHFWTNVITTTFKIATALAGIGLVVIVLFVNLLAIILVALHVWDFFETRRFRILVRQRGLEKAMRWLVRQEHEEEYRGTFKKTHYEHTALVLKINIVDQETGKPKTIDQLSDDIHQTLGLPTKT